MVISGWIQIPIQGSLSFILIALAVSFLASILIKEKINEEEKQFEIERVFIENNLFHFDF